MANITWLGRAKATAQVDTLTFANTWAAADTATVTINGKAVTFTAAGATIETIRDGLLALLQAATDPEFTEVTWAASSTDAITATGPSTGAPVTITASEVTAGTGTFTLASTTSPTGPNWADDGDNWSGGSAPGAGDDAWIENSAVSILYGLTGLSGTLTSLNIAATFTGTIGLPKTNAGGYPEYRTDYLAVNASSVRIGYGAGPGSGRIKLNLGSVQAAIQVFDTASVLEFGVPAVLLKGTHVSNTLDVQEGIVGFSFFGGEAGALATLSNVAGTVFTGSAMTQLTTVQNQAGEVHVHVATTTITQDGGITYVYGVATVGTATITGGTFDYRSSGTITTLAVGGLSVQATATFANDRSTRTVTNATIHENGRINDPASTVTWTNGVAIGANVTYVQAL